MTLLNPTVAPIARHRRAASLTEAVRWHASRLWTAADPLGGRRAASHLWRTARRWADERQEAAGQVVRAALRRTPS